MTERRVRVDFTEPPLLGPSGEERSQLKKRGSKYVTSFSCTSFRGFLAATLDPIHPWTYTAVSFRAIRRDLEVCLDHHAHRFISARPAGSTERLHRRVAVSM